MLKNYNQGKSKLSLPDLIPNFEGFSEYLSSYFSCVDENGCIYYVNRAFSEALGYKQKELIGKHAYEIVREYNSDGVFQWNRIEEVLSNPASPPTRELELCRKNGTSLWVELREKLWQVKGTQLRYSLAISIDVTEQHQQQARTQEIQQFQLISSFMNNAIKKEFECVEVVQYLKASSIEINAPFAVIYLKPHLNMPCSPQKAELTKDWKQWIIPIAHCFSANHNSVLWENSRGLFLLLSLTSDILADNQVNVFLDNITHHLNPLNGFAKILAGVSDVCQDLSCVISIPCYEAVESLNWGSIMAPDKNYYHWKNIGIGQLLLKMPSAQAKHYFEDKLGPLLALPDINRAELLQTLCEILSAHSVSESAQKMHVHPKTIAYRRARLGKLLNVDFDEPATRTELFVALRLFQLHTKDE
jgi:PAS domain S-box-containing protein